MGLGPENGGQGLESGLHTRLPGTQFPHLQKGGNGGFPSSSPGRGGVGHGADAQPLGSIPLLHFQAGAGQKCGRETIPGPSPATAPSTQGAPWGRVSGKAARQGHSVPVTLPARPLPSAFKRPDSGAGADKPSERTLPESMRGCPRAHGKTLSTIGVRERTPKPRETPLHTPRDGCPWTPPHGATGDTGQGSCRGPGQLFLGYWRPH